MKAKGWTFLDERKDLKVQTACRNLRQYKKKLIQDAESQIVGEQTTKDSTQFKSTMLPGLTTDLEASALTN